MPVIFKLIFYLSIPMTTAKCFFIKMLKYGEQNFSNVKCIYFPIKYLSYRKSVRICSPVDAAGICRRKLRSTFKRRQRNSSTNDVAIRYPIRSRFSFQRHLKKLKTKSSNVAIVLIISLLKLIQVSMGGSKSPITTNSWTKYFPGRNF